MRRRSRSCPMSSSRLASSPRTRKKNVIRPSFTQCRRSSRDACVPELDRELRRPDRLVGVRPRRVRPQQRGDRRAQQHHGAARLGPEEVAEGCATRSLAHAVRLRKDDGETDLSRLMSGGVSEAAVPSVVACVSSRRRGFALSEVFAADGERLADEAACVIKVSRPHSRRVARWENESHQFDVVRVASDIGGQPTSDEERESAKRRLDRAAGHPTGWARALCHRT